MTYKSFYDVFLVEMPMRLNGGNDFESQLEMIQENLKYNDNVEVIAPNVFKTVNDNQITYWCGDSTATNVSIIVDTEIHGTFQKIVLTSKNPKLGKTAIYASELYCIIKDDAAATNLVFSSDEFISDDAIRLWSRLVAQGHKIAVFDSVSGKYILSPISSQDELLSFVGNQDRRRYVFVMSESLLAQRGAIHGNAIMEIKRKSGYPLNQLFETFRKTK